MTTDLDQAYHGWPHGEFSGQEDSQDAANAQILDHGSISFGRFAVESLAWEKRSVFTHNQCQEELEKFKSPGLVAQKKAYFEEYYKKIRALKALQANQQTEITLDYGGDDSVSSQTVEEEDETAIRLGSPRDGATSITAACLAGPNIEVALELESTDAPHVRQLDLEPTVACPDLPTRSLEEIDLGGNSTDVLQSRLLDPESAVLYIGSSRRSIEEIEPEKISSLSIQMGHFTRESTVLDSLRRNIEEIELLEPSKVDENGIVGELGSSISTIDPGATAERTAPGPEMLKSSGSQLTPTYSHRTDKTKVPIDKYKYQTYIPKMKESDSSVRKELKPKCIAKSDGFKPSQPSKHLPHRAIGKEANDNNSSRVLANRLLSKSKSTSVSLHKPLKEACSSATVPCPFSFATERRTTTPAGTRERVPQNSNFKTSNRFTSSLLHSKRDLTAKNASMKKPFANDVKRAGLENKSLHGESLKKPFVLDRQHTNLKGADGKMHRPRAWSINLPAADKSNLNSKTEFGVRRGKAKESVPSRVVDPSLNGKKPRREVKRWR